MKCKYCEVMMTTNMEGRFGCCVVCLYQICRTAMADGYTVAGGVVMKPCSCYAEECICHGTGIVAGGGGT